MVTMPNGIAMVSIGNKLAFHGSTDAAKSAIVYWDGATAHLLGLDGMAIPDRPGQTFGRFQGFIDAGGGFLTFQGACNGLARTECHGAWKYDTMTGTLKTLAMTGDMIDLPGLGATRVDFAYANGYRGYGTNTAGVTVYEVRYGPSGAAVVVDSDAPSGGTNLAATVTARLVNNPYTHAELTTTIENKGTAAATQISLTIETEVPGQMPDQHKVDLSGVVLDPGQSHVNMNMSRLLGAGTNKFKVTVTSLEADADQTDNVATTELEVAHVFKPQSGCDVGDGRDSPAALLLIVVVSMLLGRRWRAA
jgi:hypothetical protein